MKGRIQQALLNLQAAEHEKLSGEWDVAMRYALKGVDCLPDNAWETHYKLSYELHSLHIECEYLNAHIERGNQLSEILLQHDLSNFEKANVCRLQLDYNVTRQLIWAIEKGVEGLRYCGLDIPEAQQITQQLADKEERALTEALKSVEIAQVLFSDNDHSSELTKLTCLLLVRLSDYSQTAGMTALTRYCNYNAMIQLLKYGAGTQTVAILGNYSALLAKQKHYTEADYYSKAAVKLVEKFPESTDLPMFYNIIGSMQWFYTAPFPEAVEFQAKSHKLGLEGGDVNLGVMAAYSNSIINYFVMGLPFEKLSLKLERLKGIMHKYQIKGSAAQYYENLLEGLSVTYPKDKNLQNPFDKSKLSSKEWGLIQSCCLHSLIEHLQIQWFFWSGQLEQAWHAVNAAQLSLDSMDGFIIPIEHRFVAALVACQRYPFAAENEQQSLCTCIDSAMEELEVLTKLCPENFEHKLQLLKAEQCRAMGTGMSQVLPLYDEAIRSTKQGNFIQYQAFAYERCADYWIKQGFDTAAKRYAQQAIYSYQSWGCELKSSMLKQQYVNLFAGTYTLFANEPISNTEVHLGEDNGRSFKLSSNSSSTGLDNQQYEKNFSSIMQDVQQISSELNIRKLMFKCLRLVLEITQAETVSLVMNTRKGKVLEARITENSTLENAQTLLECTAIPHAVINYVFRNDAIFNLEQLGSLSDPDKVSIEADPYFFSKQPTAMVCLPIISRDKTLGVLYLDCCSYKHYFTEYHLRIIEMLISQSTISFQNALLFSKSERLNEKLEKKIDQRTQALEASNSDLQATNNELAAFSHSVSHDLRAPLRSITGFSNILLEDYAKNLDESAVGLLTRIIDSSNKMTELINGLLELSRVQSAEIDLKPVNLAEMAQSIADTLNEKKLTQNKLAKQVVFKCPELVVVPGDERMFFSVMENLLNNAWKYSSKVEQARVEFGVTWYKGETAYYVKDNGAGFDMNHANNLFVTFKRLHLEHEFSGTGVGLDTVKRIIDKHSGKIWAESEVGKGAIFYFTLWTEES